MLKHKKERLEFSKEVEGHSSFIGLTEKEGIVISGAGMGCYYDLFHFNNLNLDYLYLFLKDSLHKYNEGWLEWLLNKSFFKNVFITKNVKEGFEYGFEVDTSQDRALMCGGMMLFRYPFENKSFSNSWKIFKEMGYDETEALALGTNFTLSKTKSLFGHKSKKLFLSSFNSNHKLIYNQQKFELYEFKGYKSHGDNLLTGYKTNYIDLSKKSYGCIYETDVKDGMWVEKYGIDFGDINKYKTLRENLDRALDIMKGVK